MCLKVVEMFQFTHPGRGATLLISLVGLLGAVSIHAPREGCDVKDLALKILMNVSIHAPREGCDEDITARAIPTSVSIHAPREGCDTPHNEENSRA